MRQTATLLIVGLYDLVKQRVVAAIFDERVLQDLHVRRDAFVRSCRVGHGACSCGPRRAERFCLICGAASMWCSLVQVARLMKVRMKLHPGWATHTYGGDLAAALPAHKHTAGHR